MRTGDTTKSGNFVFHKRIKDINQFWEVVNTDKSIYARCRMYPTAFFRKWKIKEINEWITKGWFWQMKKNKI